MKNIFVLFIVFMIGVSAVAQTQTKPTTRSDEDDGVSLSIDPAEVKDLLRIAQHSKLELEEALRKIAKEKFKNRHKILRSTIDNVIDGSDDKGKELYMRSVLRRARLLDDIIMKSSESPERYTVSYRLLRLSVLWAIQLYEPEQRILDLLKTNPSRAIAPTNFFKLGVYHAHLMLGLFDLAPQHDTKFELAQASLKILYNDLKRDIVVRQVASHVIGSMTVFLNDIESKKPKNDLDGLALYREVNDFIRDRLQQLETLVKDLGMDVIPKVPTVGQIERSADPEGRAVLLIRHSGDIKKSKVYVGVRPTKASGSEILWLRENNVTTPPNVTITVNRDDNLADETPAFVNRFGKVEKGDQVIGEHNGKIIVGTANRIFDNSYIEIRVQTINSEIYDGYAVWSTDWIRKAN